MNRRRLLQGVVAGAAGLLLPPSVGEVAAEVERRYWALGQMPGRVGNGIYLRDLEYAPILVLHSDMGETRLDACTTYAPGGKVAIKDAVLEHAHWLRERGARDVVLYSHAQSQVGMGVAFLDRRGVFEDV